MWNRIASVEYAGRAGAGCIVAPGVILTARHIVECAAGHENESPIVQISNHETQGPRARAELAWQRGDIALLRCRPRDLGLEFPPVRWGELACTKPPAPRPECSAMGLPHEAMRRIFGGPPQSGGGNEFRQPQGVTGHITSVGTASRIYSLQTDHQPPEHMRKDGFPWQGMAGAAVFCGELLIGLLAHPPSGWSHGRLEAVPARQLLEDRGFCDIVQTACGMRPRLEAADLDGLFDGPPQPVAAASYLLSPRSEAVDFLGLDAEISGLADWCHTPQAVDVALLQGEGGSGKTRLSTELVRRLSERRAEAEHDPSGPDVPWTAGFLSDTPVLHPAPYGMLRHLTRPALIVVDDAESRLHQIEELLTALTEHQAPPGRRIRVLLTARSVQHWWEELQRRHPAITGGTTLLLDPGAVYRQYTPAQVQELAELNYSKRILALHRAGIRDDWNAYKAADQRAALPSPAKPESHSNGIPGVLTIHTEALASVLLQSPGEPLDSHSATMTLLDHELQYMRRAACGEGLEEIGPDLLRTLVTVQSMAGAQDKEEADAVIQTAWEFQHRHAPRPLDPDMLLKLRHAAADLYPALDGGYFASAGPAALTATLIDRAEKESGSVFLTHILPSPTLSPHQRQRSLATIARSIPTQPQLARPTANAIRKHPDILASPATDIARQLPEPCKATWPKTTEKASPGAGAQVRTRPPADTPTTPPTPDLRQDGTRQDGTRDDGQRQDGQRQDGIPQDGQRGDGIRQDGQRQDGIPQDGVQTADVREAGVQTAAPRTPRPQTFWDSINSAGATQLLIMISIPLALVVTAIWITQTKN